MQLNYNTIYLEREINMKKKRKLKGWVWDALTIIAIAAVVAFNILAFYFSYLD